MDSHSLIELAVQTATTLTTTAMQTGNLKCAAEDVKQYYSSVFHHTLELLGHASKVKFGWINETPESTN